MPRSERIGLALFLAGVVAACGGGGEKVSATATAGGDEGAPPVAPTSRSATSAGRPAAVEWVDPEPPGAQALAELVVDAPWNRDKSTALTPRVTGLTMNLTSLVDSRTGIAGFQTAVTAAGTGLDDRLTRLGAEQTATEVTIRLPGSVLFDFDSAALRPDAERALGDVAAVLAGYPDRPVRIEGHTDSIASEAYNLDLSKRRAESVRAWLVAHGADPRRLTTTGYGESRPVADNATAAGRQKNRRVEIVIAKGG